MKPVKNNLVALGSAAVFTVYAAGFMRTKSAADRFASEDTARDRAVATREHDPGPPPTIPSVPVSADHIQSAPQAQGDVGVAKHAAPTPPTPAPRTPADSVTLVQAPPTDTTPVPQVIAPPAAVPVSPPPVRDTSADSQAADSSAQKKEAAFKDGIYSGWGTSRHGDIQASVEIRDGRIVSASITQCLTRYSCSWVSSLPPQVVSRQSANVDYISGATQSSNAFYSAIVEALSKAK